MTWIINVSIITNVTDQTAEKRVYSSQLCYKVFCCCFFLAVSLQQPTCEGIKLAVLVERLTHFSRKTPKRVICKQCRPRLDATECGIWSGSTLFALNTGISIKHSKNKTNQTANGNRLLQKVVIEEYTWHKWVKSILKYHVV